jgi:aryl-alcohol dehydrogenase-like predicted oxidoreductase
MTTMMKRTFGRTGWQVSAIGLGTWNLGNQWGEMDDETAVGIIRAAHENGMNLFDAAESYGIPNGLSEIRLGKALKEIRKEATREEFYVVSKIGFFGSRTGCKVPKETPDMIRLSGHACLGRLQTSHIDLLLCHEANITEPGVYIEGFENLRKEGFIREYGISTDSLDVLQNFYAKSGGACAAVELDYSLINRQAEGGVLDFCREKNLGVLVRGPVAQGLLAGKYSEETVFTDTVRARWNSDGKDREDFLEKLAMVETLKGNLDAGDNLVETGLKYVISHPANPVAIPGATSVQQATLNARAGESVLSDEMIRKIRVLA